MNRKSLYQTMKSFSQNQTILKKQQGSFFLTKKELLFTGISFLSESL